MYTVEGSLLVESNEVIELALGLTNLTEIEWIVEVNVYGKNTPATYNDPEEYEEIDNVEVLKVILYNDTSETIATQEQIDILEKFRPNDSYDLWDIVHSN